MFVMALITNSILSSPGSSVRNIDRVFEDGQLKGELKLNSRKLKEFPKVACKYDLSDIAKADLSKNRLSELPEEICSYTLLEEIDCYNNVIKSVPSAIVNLQSLAYLNLSRNQLTVIPLFLCQLPLQVLTLRNNRLVSIPEEIALMKCLKDFDVSCNEIAVVPPQLGFISSLQRLNLKRNLLVELPTEICNLRLISLNISANRISTLPTQLRFMTSLQELILDQNPMTFPPAVLCKRGRIHIFKFLEIQAIKEDKRGIVLESEFQKFRSPSVMSDIKLQNGYTSGNCKKSYTFDSGYSTSDGDCRSQESQELVCGFKKSSGESPRKETVSSLSLRNQNTNTLFNYIPVNGEVYHENKGVDDNSAVPTVQTFKEYKEALKKKREAEATNIYKKVTPEENSPELSPKLNVVKNKSAVASKYSLRKDESFFPSNEDNLKGTNNSLVNSWQYESPLQEFSTDDIPKINVSLNYDSKKTGNDVKPAHSNDASITSVYESSESFVWPKSSFAPVKPLKSSFTIKREFDKAREEQELISQLREILESRLKLKLPEEMESALNDGVFLCHLANNIRANSISCIHVPSPTVPKLPAPKCRRNADNFLEACKQLGVSSAELHCWADSYFEWKALWNNPLHTKEMPILADSPLGQAILSYFLLAVFISTVIFLYKFPTPY